MKKLLLFLIFTTGVNAEYTSTYLEQHMKDRIRKEEIRLILEIGSSHCLDAVLLHEYYNCPVIAFEAAPQLIPRCKEAIKDHPSIQLINKAIWSKPGPLEFNYCTSSPATSSVYSFDYPSLAEHNKTDIKTEQNNWPVEKTLVEAVRLDEWMAENNIERVDLICMDVQGAALEVLKSLGNKLQEVKYIITEVEYKPIYQDEKLFPEINAFMTKNGFTCFYQLDDKSLFNDVLYIRNDLLN